MAAIVPVLFITGPIGVGKTTVASEISEQLEQAGVAHALVDVDAIRECYPRPVDDYYQTRLAMKNLAALWQNFQAEGATHLIIIDVLESRADLERYREVVPGAHIVVVRLYAPLHTLHERIQHRELASSLDWHLQRTVELAALMERQRIEDVLVDTEGKTVPTIAHEILSLSGWLETSGV
jgi:adenylylsulfate kinase